MKIDSNDGHDDLSGTRVHGLVARADDRLVFDLFEPTPVALDFARGLIEWSRPNPPASP